MNKNGEIDFSEVKSFNLDEYYPISSENEQSYHYFMNKNLFNNFNIKEENTHILDGAAKDTVKECTDFENLIEKNGGIDLQILGIGENGHIGFNEPSAKLNTKTHLTLLTESTINANSRFFTSADEVPHSALTMGIATILKSKKIILMASGAAKHCAVKAMLKETVDTDVPATVLNLHDDVVLSRKKVIRTPILRGGFSLSTSLKYSAIRQDYLRFFLAQSKIRSLKILRPEKNRILSRFWCGR